MCHSLTICFRTDAWRFISHPSCSTNLILINAVFIYAYIPIVYAILIGVGYILIKRKNVIVIAQVMMASTLFALAFSPHNLINNGKTIKKHITSAHPEKNLFGGMQGNTVSHLNPLQGMSMWFSHNVYMYANSLTRNSWIAYFLIILYLALLTFTKKNRTCRKNTYFVN